MLTVFSQQIMDQIKEIERLKMSFDMKFFHLYSVVKTTKEISDGNQKKSKARYYHLAFNCTGNYFPDYICYDTRDSRCLPEPTWDYYGNRINCTFSFCCFQKPDIKK